MCVFMCVPVQACTTLDETNCNVMQTALHLVAAIHCGVPRLVHCYETSWQHFIVCTSVAPRIVPI